MGIQKTNLNGSISTTNNETARGGKHLHGPNGSESTRKIPMARTSTADLKTSWVKAIDGSHQMATISTPQSDAANQHGAAEVARDSGSNEVVHCLTSMPTAIGGCRECGTREAMKQTIAPEGDGAIAELISTPLCHNPLLNRVVFFQQWDYQLANTDHRLATCVRVRPGKVELSCLSLASGMWIFSGHLSAALPTSLLHYQTPSSDF